MAERRVEILYRRSTASWKAQGFTREGAIPVPVCSYGSLRRARRRAQEWLRDREPPTLFETIRP